MSGCGKLRGRMGVWVRDAAEMREQGRPGRESRGQATATRAGRELSLPGAADLGSGRGEKAMEGLSLERAAALGALLFVGRNSGSFRALAGVPGSWDAQGCGSSCCEHPPGVGV